ncbi:hypothetical protein CR513_14591, partial [Mucuna pruriens]
MVPKWYLKELVNLNSVLYIPKYPYNLISLSQLTCSLNCLVTFFHVDSFVIQDRNTGQLIGEGHESRGLYYLCNNLSTLCFASISPKLLHNRLGYLSLAKLKLMVPCLNKLSTLECESCQLSKHVRSTFPNQVNKRCNFPFSIVHSNIWEPSRVTSFAFNYFVTFIDEEYSRCTWVYLMKERYDFLSILIVFGCICFVHDVSPSRDKLSARAIKCVFLGYSRLQKDTNVTLHPQKDTICQLMLHF